MEKLKEKAQLEGCVSIEKRCLHLIRVTGRPFDGRRLSGDPPGRGVDTNGIGKDREKSREDEEKYVREHHDRFRGNKDEEKEEKREVKRKGRGGRGIADKRAVKYSTLRHLAAVHSLP
jgi:hypothetical protein